MYNGPGPPRDPFRAQAGGWKCGKGTGVRTLRPASLEPNIQMVRDEHVRCLGLHKGHFLSPQGHSIPVHLGCTLDCLVPETWVSDQGNWERDKGKYRPQEVKSRREHSHNVQINTEKYNSREQRQRDRVKNCISVDIPQLIHLFINSFCPDYSFLEHALEFYKYALTLSIVL